jgi:hypothetical protein
LTKFKFCKFQSEYPSTQEDIKEAFLSACKFNKSRDVVDLLALNFAQYSPS